MRHLGKALMSPRVQAPSTDFDSRASTKHLFCI